MTSMKNVYHFLKGSDCVDCAVLICTLQRWQEKCAYKMLFAGTQTKKRAVFDVVWCLSNSEI